MRNVLNHMGRLLISKAFKTWSEKSYAIKQEQLAKDLAQKEQEKRKLIEEQKKNNFENSEEVVELNGLLEAASNKKE